MNGIHEVTGSIPVWSTILRSPVHASELRMASPDTERHQCTRLTSCVSARLSKHNAGTCVHTATGRPWQVDVVIEFTDQERAVAFEKYLKSGSGVAFAKRHLR